MQTTTLEQIINLLAYNNSPSTLQSEVQILATYGDGSLLVGYISRWQGIQGKWHDTRRVAYIVKDEREINRTKQIYRIKWDNIAE